MLLVLFSSLVWPVAAWGGSALQPQAVQALHAWVGHELTLRGFPRENSFSVDMNGRLIKPRTLKAGPWTLARMEVTKVTLGNNKIDIHGTRIASIYAPSVKGHWLFRPVPGLDGNMTIHVLLGPFTTHFTTANVKAVRTALFMDDFSQFLDAVPDYWRPYFVGKFPTPLPKLGTFKLLSPAVVRREPKLDGYIPIPDIPVPARHLHLAGIVGAAVTIGPDGRPSNLVIRHPVGAGLDDTFANIVLQSRWKPAIGETGQPVACRLLLWYEFRLN